VTGAVGLGAEFSQGTSTRPLRERLDSSRPALSERLPGHFFVGD